MSNVDKRIPDRYASIERSTMPADNSFDEIEIIEMEHAFTNDNLQIRLDMSPADTVALDLNDAVAKAIALQKLKKLHRDNGQELGYRVEFQA